MFKKVVELETVERLQYFTIFDENNFFEK